jgi:threonine aldolase
VPGIKINPASLVTNILVFDIAGTGMNSLEFNRKLAEQDVLANGVNPETMRFVTHMDVDRAGCARALKAVQTICCGRVPRR